MTLYDLCKDKTMPVVVYNGKNYYRIRKLYDITIRGIRYRDIAADLGFKNRSNYLRFLKGGWVINEAEASANNWTLVNYTSIKKT